MPPRPNPDTEKVFAVSEITNLIKGLLEESFGAVWVEGEISNYTLARSGHRYFSLKDNDASLRCAIWRGAGSRLTFEPSDGQRVRAYGSLSVYPPHGSYQLSVRNLIDAGIGPLEVAFRKLKEKLQREGLFDADRKRPLPVFPSVVGVVTSPTGAAFKDISKTIAQRHPGMRIVLAPARVQGDGAAREIVTAIENLNRHDAIDVLIVGRGGGSLEDLWAFNEEIVARAIVSSRIPVVAAVGHEVDFTIADGVADFRAPTPTGAAERITDGWVRARHEFGPLVRRLRQAVDGTFAWYRQQCLALQRSHALRRPADLLHVWAQRLDETTDRLSRSMGQRTDSLRQSLDAAAGKLEALAPESVLRRGYSITRLAGDTRALRDTRGIRAGARIETTLSDGRMISEVVEPPSSASRSAGGDNRHSP